MVLDMVGNVWQYTSSEFIDEHGRAVLLRGGSHYLLTSCVIRVLSRLQRSHTSVTQRGSRNFLRTS
jgi:formylglycine-generating enzyme required for sulfatase activity